MARSTARLTRDNLGYLLAKASQRWNALLYERFRQAGFPQVRPAYGAALIPLFEENALQLGELARRAGLSKQTMTTLVRQLEAAGLAARRPDPADGRAARVHLSPEARRFQPVAEAVLGELDAAVAAALGAGARSLPRSLKALGTLRLS